MIVKIRFTVFIDGICYKCKILTSFIAFDRREYTRIDCPIFSMCSSSSFRELRRSLTPKDSKAYVADLFQALRASVQRQLDIKSDSKTSDGHRKGMEQRE
jgi:hypothetical protein